MPNVMRKRMRDGTVKEIHFGTSVATSRAKGNMKNYFYLQDRGELRGSEIRISPISTHKFSR